VLRSSGLKPAACNPDADIAALAKRLYERGQALREAVKLLAKPEVFELAVEVRKDNRGLSISKVTNHVLIMTAQSGLVAEELFSWLSGLITAPQPDALRELNEIELMQNELQWQLNNAHKVFRAFLDAGTNAGAAHTRLNEIAAELHAQLEKL
jgi:hypothetical protein